MFQQPLNNVLQGRNIQNNADWSDAKLKLAQTGVQLQNNVHQQAMDMVNATNTERQRQEDNKLKMAQTGVQLQNNVHQQAMDMVNATTTERQRKKDFQLRELHESHDYDIRMREQLRKDRELEARLAREQAEDDRELMQSLQNTQIHTQMQHSAEREARKAARLITNVGCFTCEGTENLVNELLQKRMQSNPVTKMPSAWRECVSEVITSHGEMVVADLARRYHRLRGATLDNYVLTDEPQVHTTFARAIAAQIRHTAVSSGLSYKSKYALEATQQTMGRAIRFFERVTHDGAHNFSVSHDKVDTGLPPASVAKFRRGGALWASSSPASFWA